MIIDKRYLRSKFRYYFFLLFYALFYWNFAIRLAITIQALGFKSTDLRHGFTRGMEFMMDQIAMSSIIISVMATASWFIQNFVYPKVIMKYKIKRLAIFIVLFDIILFVVIAIMLGVAHYIINEGFSIKGMIPELGRFLFNSTVLFFFIVLFVASFVYQLLLTLFRQIGYDKVNKLMFGYYQKPREESHIFMFLDLQSSTTFAEKLGHKKYSYFIQDCFRLISSPLLLTKGRIYQYVGDEAVVTWNASKAKNYKLAVDFYFLYVQELNKHSDYFQKKYGLMPVFTASLNVGKVMAAEVGEIKTELGFYGDVLNTAARIQKQCKQFNKPLLCTISFVEMLKETQNGYRLNFMENVSLRGKAEKVELYAIDLK